jgi:MFS family permease
MDSMNELDTEKLHKKTRRLSFMDTFFYNGFFIITQGFILTGLALEYRAEELVISVIGVLPVLSQLVQLLVPFIMNRTGTRKRALLSTALISRITVAFISITLATGMVHQSILLILLSVIAICNSFASNFWVSIMKDIVPANISGRFYSRRNLLSSFTAMSMTFIYSSILDNVPGRKGFIIVSIIATGFALADFLVLALHYVPPRQEPSYSVGVFIRPLKDLQFRKFISFSFVWNFALAISSPFFSYHQIINLKLDYSFMSIMTIVNSLSLMVFYLLWGKITDEIGGFDVAHFTLGITIFLPITWVFTNLGTIFLIPVNQVVSGFAWSGVNLTLFTTMMTLFPGERAEAYFAVLSFANGLGALSGSLLGGVLATLMKSIKFDIFGFPFYGIQLLFVFSSLFRFLAWTFLKRIRVGKKSSIPMIIYNITAASANRSVARIFEFPSIYAAIKGRVAKKIVRDD